MKIRNVKVIVTCPGRNYVVVKIETDEPEVYGVGDATLNGRELAVALGPPGSHRTTADRARSRPDRGHLAVPRTRRVLARRARCR